MLQRSQRRLLVALPLLLPLGCSEHATDASQPTLASELESQDQVLCAAPDPGTWEMASRDPLGHHANPAETAIGPTNAYSLKTAWVFDNLQGEDLGALHGTPVVTDSAVYAGSNNGRFYALSLDGELLWTYTTLPPNPLLGVLATPAPVGGQIPVMYGTPIVGGAVYSAKEDIVVFGDLDGNVYALDGTTGAEVWVKPQLDPHPLGGVVGNSLLLANNDVVIGFAAIEDAALIIPTLGIPYQCCSHTGLVVSIGVKEGKERWRFETIKPSDVQPLPESAAPFTLGPSGADIWGQPTYDAETQTVYFGTGQNYSPKAAGGGTGTSDAIVAVNAKTGKLKWVRQITADDIWVLGIPSPDPVTGKWTDQDFGDAVKIYNLPDGRRVVGAAQKSGAYTVLDAKTGAVIKTTQIVQQANQLGGLQNGSAYGNGKVFVHGLHGSDPMDSTAPFTGVVKALSPDGTTTHWTFPVPMSVFAAPLALANNVLWVLAPVSEANFGVDPQKFTLLGLHADTGAVVAGHQFPGRAISGPVVSNGRVYLVTGNRAIDALGTNDHGSVIALELP